MNAPYLSLAARAKELLRNALRFNTLSSVLVIVFMIPTGAHAVGQWVPLHRLARGNVGHMLLLSDGTVMAQICTNANDCGTEWVQLAPDINGSYVNGAWADRSPMTTMRVNYSSTILRNGKVFVIGGEGASITPIDPAQAEIYDPSVNPPLGEWYDLPQPPPTNLWDTASHTAFADASCMLLPDGSVLEAPVYPKTGHPIIKFNPNSQTWSDGGIPFGSQDEACWVKLSDDSILTIDFNWDGQFTTNSERYIPSQNQWIRDAAIPINIYSNQEMGCGLLLPDGRAFFLGGSGHTALYTPTGTTEMGSWAAGPDMPANRVAADAPAAMMVNGKILCAVGPYSANGGSPSPTWFYEYDYRDHTTGTNGTFMPTSCPDNASIGSAYANAAGNLCFLALPDGNVLVSVGISKQLYEYQPDCCPVASGKPVVNSITLNPDGSYHLTGTGLNGISVGAAFGDDSQMDSNYPLVRLADSSANVYYARTYNWSSTSVMTGTKLVTTEFVVPLGLPPGAYSLVVVANGIASDSVPFYGPLWVDFTYIGTFQFGTYAFPYNTLASGTNYVFPRGTIFLKPGNSHETMKISKPMTMTAIGGSAIIGR